MDGTQAHIERKLSETTIEKHPFPHMIVEGFFPVEVFAKLLAYNPFKKNSGVEWKDREASADVTSKTPYYARKQINFHKNQEFEAPPEQLQFWAGLKGRYFENTTNTFSSGLAILSKSRIFLNYSRKNSSYSAVSQVITLAHIQTCRPECSAVSSPWQTA